jgi:DMSO/TMAO reductase YedYZ molybdopterin-dependent catalytic subunit
VAVTDDRTPSARVAAASGILATVAGLGAGHLVAALVAPESSPAVAVGSRVVDLTPFAVKEWAIGAFGTWDKTVLLGGVLLITLALGAGVGLLARRTLASGLVAGGVLVLLALAAAFVDRARSLAWPVPGLVALVVGALALRALWGRLTAPVDPHSPVADAQSRRRFVTLAASLGAVGAVGGLLGEWLRRSSVSTPLASGPIATLPPGTASPFPAGLEAQVPGLSPFVTPASDFYRIDTAIVPPTVDAATWALTIDGLVDHPFTIGWDELLALDPVERAVTLECVSNDVGGGLIGSARWLGVRTAALLARAGVRAGADMVLSTSRDGFTVSTPLPALLDDRDALVAYGMNRAVLPREHGYPVRLITPGLYGYVGATKWLVHMEVTTFRAAQAYWTKQGWSDHGPIKPGSRIEVPRTGARVPAGTLKVGGTAWAHGVGVGGVQVRVDRGPWQDATLGPDGGLEFWRQWLWTWDAVAGDHELQVRVVDAHGAAQDEKVLAPFPDGATGLHTINVSVG